MNRSSCWLTSRSAPAAGPHDGMTSVRPATSPSTSTSKLLATAKLAHKCKDLGKSGSQSGICTSVLVPYRSTQCSFDSTIARSLPGNSSSGSSFVTADVLISYARYGSYRYASRGSSPERVSVPGRQCSTEYLGVSSLSFNRPHLSREKHGIPCE